MSGRTELPHNCRRISWRNAYYAEAPSRDNERVRYGSWRDASDGEWFLCNELSYSDYSNTKPWGESNVRVFAEMFSSGEGVWWGWADGGYDTTAIVIRTLAYRNAREVREVIDGLSDYPYLDESDASELECEREQEGWNDYGRDDMRREMRAYLAEQGREDADELVDALSDSQVDALYYQRCQDTNVNGGASCMFEGESHPHFFTEEAVRGCYRHLREDDPRRNAWNLEVPVADENGKVVYHTGEPADWVSILTLAKELA